jgi:hypothetical protein
MGTSERELCAGCGEQPCEHGSWMGYTVDRPNGEPLHFRYCLCFGCDTVTLNKGETWEPASDHGLRAVGGP